MPGSTLAINNGTVATNQDVLIHGRLELNGGEMNGNAATIIAVGATAESPPARIAWPEIAASSTAACSRNREGLISIHRAVRIRPSPMPKPVLGTWRRATAQPLPIMMARA